MKNQLLVDWLLGLAPKLSPTYITYSWLIHTTIYVTITALFIILFKQIFKNRLRAKWHFLIWAVLLVRLVVPVLPSSPVSVFNTVKVDEEIIRQSSYQSYTESNFDEEIGDDTYSVAQGLQKMVEADNGKGDFQGVTSRGYTVPVDAIVTYIWTGGVFLLLGYFTVILIIHRKRLKKSRRLCGSEADSILEKCKEKLNIKRKVSLYYADTTPVLIGLFKPAIYIPDALTQSELEATLLHELNHMKHLDILWSTIAAVVLCLNWFNPIIWVSFFMFKRDLEVYCDERTLRYAENKQGYAMLLLKTATARKERFVLGTTSLQSGKADVKRRIRFMAKYKRLKTAGAVTAIVLVSALLMGCLTNAGAFNLKNTTIENPANGCKIDIVLDKSFAGNDYLTGNGTFFEFHTDKSIEEIANQIISDNPDFGIMYQDDKQALLRQDNPYSQAGLPYFLLTKKISDKYGNDVENVVFLEALGTRTYLPSYTNALETTGAYATEKKYSYYFPEHLRADYRYTNYENHSYEVNTSNPFDDEIKLIDNGDTYNQLVRFYFYLPPYRNSDLERKEYDNGNGEIIMNNASGEQLYKVFYNAERNTLRYIPYAAFAAESASSVIYRLENAIQRQDKDMMESCFDTLTYEDYQALSSIKPDFSVERIYTDSIDNVNFKYSFRVHAMIDYDNGMGYNKHNKRFTVEFIGEEPKITFTQLSSFDENANNDESDQTATYLTNSRSTEGSAKNLFSSLFTYGGLHDSDNIHAKNLITNEIFSISLKVHNTANTGNFSNFTSPLNYDEMADELRGKNNIIDVTFLNHYLRLQTDSGEFYIKYNGRFDNEYSYSLFAEVGKVSDFGEYIYIPFHMLRYYPENETPAVATPFEGQVYFDNTQFNLDDFASYYKNKGYSVEKNEDESLIIVTDKLNSYSFKLRASDYGDYGLFELEDDYANTDVSY